MKTAFKVIGWVFLGVFIISFFRYFLGAQPISFNGFLEFLSNCPKIDLSTAYLDLTIVSDWGLFNFLRDFINIFGSMGSVVLFITANLVQLLLFILYFIGYIFI